MVKAAGWDSVREVWDGERECWAVRGEVGEVKGRVEAGLREEGWDLVRSAFSTLLICGFLRRSAC